MVEEHQNSNNTPYKFNAKELDDETGNYYYGARYYNPKFSIWLSVDPLAETMPEWSSYNYAFSNPVIYTDPTGMVPEHIYELDKKTGNVTLKERNNDKTDTLVGKDGGATISSNVDKGLLKDGQNIKKNGLQTSSVNGGGSLAVDISMAAHEEVVMVIYQNDSGGKYLEVRPFDNNTVVRNDEGQVIEMNGGTSQEIKSSFNSSDGSFSGKPKYSVHTHPGHPDGVDNIGKPDPSNRDVTIAINNKKINKVDIPYFIIGSKSSNRWGKASTRTKYNAKGSVKTVQPPKGRKY